jgi:NAD(P)-dependent dehydrogenase (short-subunit alcohol dehydrogenase family)
MKLGEEIAAVVTGGASGLGAATARRLARDGVKVAIFDVTDQGEAVAKEIGGLARSSRLVRPILHRSPASPDSRSTPGRRV